MNQPSRSVIGSLKGRIWLAAGTLAIVDCLLGLAAYLILTFLSADPFLTLFATIMLLTLATLVFGWWLAKDVLKPVEEVALLARSLERSASATLPRTTGAIETDQLLQTLHRNGQQVRNLIAVMDDVAAGKTDAATIPLESSDKLSSSFQKLVSKVTDSISAKRDLDELNASIAQLSADVARIRGGQLELNIRAEQQGVKEIADSIRFLSSRLAELTKRVFATTSECERAAGEARASLAAGLEAIDNRSHNVAAKDAKRDEQTFERVLDELAAAVSAASETYDRYVAENTTSPKASNASEKLRSSVIETGHLIQKLRGRASAVAHLARLAQDLSKRSNLIALNASIASNGHAAPGILVSEIESLSERSEDLYKQIILAGESLNSEVAGLEKEISALSEVAPDLGRSMNASMQVSHSLCERIVMIGDLEKRIREAADASTLENDRLAGLVEKLSDVSAATALVRQSETSVQRFSTLLEGLRDSVSDLKISASTPVRPSPAIPETPSFSAANKPQHQIPEPVEKGTFEMFVETNSPGLNIEPAAASGFETLIDVSASFGEN